MDLLSIITLSLKQMGDIELKPSLMWILRDLHLNLAEIDSDRYLGEHLKKEWKEVLNLAFENLKCVGLPNMLNSNFIEEIDLNEVLNNYSSHLTISA